MAPTAPVRAASTEVRCAFCGRHARFVRFGPLRRRPHVLTLNSTNVLNNTTVLSLRYGFSTWQDSCDAQPFSAGLQSLGFSPTYVNALGPGGSETFPSLQFDNTEDVVWKSFRNLGQRVKLMLPRELNAYDILVSDWVVFSKATLEAAVAHYGDGDASSAAPDAAPAPESAPAPEAATEPEAGGDAE